MTLGPFGAQFNRRQTWWPMAGEYTGYLTRCQYILQQGTPVSDVLYLTPEGAPVIFDPPATAMEGHRFMPDQRGYRFDGCSPVALMEKASVNDRKVVFPGGAEYHLLVLPALETMTPALLEKIKSLAEQGAVICGNPPVKSPSLADLPEGDLRLKKLASEIWGGSKIPAGVALRQYRRGTILWGTGISPGPGSGLYPAYETTAAILEGMGVLPDFKADGPLRFTHLRYSMMDIYFLSNRTDSTMEVECMFRNGSGIPELWDPLNGEIRELIQFKRAGGYTRVPMRLEPWQSYFMVFGGLKSHRTDPADIKQNCDEVFSQAVLANFPQPETAIELEGPWEVTFDQTRGGPGTVSFGELTDWTRNPEKGIRYYSGIAIYRTSFDLPAGINIDRGDRIFLDLGEVNHMARVRLNGKETGVVWTEPCRVEMTEQIQSEQNFLEIEVANLWPNRMIGDEQYPWDGPEHGTWPEWLLTGKARPTNRLTFTPLRGYYQADSELIPSGLLGPVKLLRKKFSYPHQ
jgi:hypothetical protein